VSPLEKQLEQKHKTEITHRGRGVSYELSAPQKRQQQKVAAILNRLRPWPTKHHWHDVPGDDDFLLLCMGWIEKQTRLSSTSSHEVRSVGGHMWQIIFLSPKHGR